MSDIDWTKAPPGTNAWLDGIWHKQQGSQCFYWDAESEIWRLTRLTQYGLSIILRRPDGKNYEPIPWTGDGLPPVGEVCEVSLSHINDGAWTAVEILAHAKHDSDDAVLVREKNRGTMHGVIYDRSWFRPIRTPEQIAEEERKAAIEEMVAASPVLEKGWCRVVCEALYDAGYRKAGDA